MFRSNTIMPMREKTRLWPGDDEYDEDDIEMQKYAGRGLNIKHLEDEEQQYDVLQCLRMIPTPLPTKRRLKEKLFSGPVKGLTGFGAWKYRQKVKWGRFKASLQGLAYKLELWGSSLRHIEGYQGTGVVSYFVLLRWLLKLNILIFLMVFIFMNLPMIAYPSWNFTNTTSLDAVCSQTYTVNISSETSQLVIDFFQGTGWMENTVMFYGYYSGYELNIGSAGASFIYDLPLAYIVTAVICLFVSLFLMTRYTAKGFRENILASGESNLMFTNELFTTWDFSLSDEHAAETKHRSIYNNFAAEMAEQRFERDRLEHMDTWDAKCSLYTVRAILNIFVLGCLCGGGYLIYYITIFSSSYIAEKDGSDTSNVILLLVQYLPPITITVLNALLPIIFQIVVKFEKYTQDFIVKITLIRTVFLKLASLTVLVGTLYAEITCTTKNSCGKGMSPCTEIQCWETYVGQQLYKLVITDFLVGVGTVLFVEIPRRIIVNKCKCGLTEKIGAAQFDIPKNVLDLVYSQILYWMGMFFAPILPAIAVLKLFIVFYAKKLSALFACEPPEKPYKTSRSNSFFMVVLILAFFICCFPVGYTMATLAPSKSCGPFRQYSFMYNAITVPVFNGPVGFQTFYNIITSPAVTASTIIILLVLIYYCSAVSSAHKDMSNLLREEIILEGKDRQFLLNKLQDVTGEAPVMHRRRSMSHTPKSPSVPRKDSPTPKGDIESKPYITAKSRSNTIEQIQLGSPPNTVNNEGDFDF